MAESSDGWSRPWAGATLSVWIRGSSSTFLHGVLTCLILSAAILTRSPIGAAARTSGRPGDFMGPGMIARDPRRQSTIYCSPVNTSAIDVITGWCYHYQRRYQLHWLTLAGSHSTRLLWWRDNHQTAVQGRLSHGVAIRGVTVSRWLFRIIYWSAYAAVRGSKPTIKTPMAICRLLKLMSFLGQRSEANHAIKPVSVAENIRTYHRLY